MRYVAALPRTQVSAACTDSCITGPSCPVIISPLLPPGMRPASTNSTSPPTGVHARPAGAFGHFRIRPEPGRAQVLFHQLRRDFHRPRRPFRDPPRLFAADRADLALQVPNPGLARVAADQKTHGFVRELNPALRR